MARVTVYFFWTYDIEHDRSTWSKSMRTKKQIQSLRGSPILETALEVDEADLDDDRRYCVPAHIAEAHEERWRAQVCLGALKERSPDGRRKNRHEPDDPAERARLHGGNITERESDEILERSTAKEEARLERTIAAREEQIRLWELSKASSRSPGL